MQDPERAAARFKGPSPARPDRQTTTSRSSWVPLPRPPLLPRIAPEGPEHYATGAHERVQPKALTRSGTASRGVAAARRALNEAREATPTTIRPARRPLSRPEPPPRERAAEDAGGVRLAR